MTRRTLAQAFGSFAFTLALLALGFYLKPLESVVLLRKAALKRAGVKRVHAATLAAYEEDLCSPGRPCRCVALIHGLGDSALTWDNILLGKRGAAAPKPGTRYLAVELPGSEGSDAPAAPGGYSIPAMSDAVRDALQTRCSSWTVAGNSLGGWIAATVALRWPQGVRRLVLINNAGVADPTGRLVQAARTLESPTVALMKDFIARAYHAHAPVPDRAWPAIVAQIRGRPTARIVAALSEKDLLDGRLRAIRAPTTIVWGESDGVVPRAVGEAFARQIPGARLVGVPDCGHLPQQECPAAVTRALDGAD